jgi:hydroxymethylpyrimidine/phosphomethylpyrimidine kinase
LYLLSIAGFDPSCGAGAMADIKTFEQHKTIGLSVLTCLTCQNDVAMKSITALSNDEISNQLTILFARFKIKFIKIGLVANFTQLEFIIDLLKSLNPDAKILWDPILKSSTGFQFHSDFKKSDLIRVLKKIYLITPNWNEASLLFPEFSSPQEAAYEMVNYCMVYLKGGHHTNDIGRDYLYLNPEKSLSFKPKRISPYSKHGSGCVFSASLLANLAKAYPIQKACLRSKDYVLRFLESNASLVGYHHF